MNRAAFVLVILVVALTLEACLIVPVSGDRRESGVRPSKVTPHFTTRAKLYKKAYHPDARTRDERFFLYDNTGSRRWGVCYVDITGSDFCAPAGREHWARWVLIEFDDKGVVKREIIRDCEGVCGSPQAALLALLKEEYGAGVAGQYQGEILDRHADENRHRSYRSHPQPPSPSGVDGFGVDWGGASSICGSSITLCR